MTVLIRMCDPSGSTSTHTGVVCGDPSGMTVAIMASCFSCSSFTPPGDNRSARGICTPCFEFDTSVGPQERQNNRNCNQRNDNPFQDFHAADGDLVGYFLVNAL